MTGLLLLLKEVHDIDMGSDGLQLLTGDFSEFGRELIYNKSEALQ